ncbi:Uncharacterized protein SCF082_LOCUS18655 [Durusdinium trenchii]|uniref:Uncharacterized protein n=1 Tax=Durusdinium trenchii TaxID=1381693 RepID=A0ABP0KSF4_9DINO
MCSTDIAQWMFQQIKGILTVRPPQRRPELAVTGTPGRAERAPPLRVSPLEILFSSDENSGLDGFQPEGVDIGMLLDDAVFRVKANGMGDIWYLGYENPLEVLRLSGGALMSLEDWKLYVLQKAAAKRLPAQPIILVRIQDPEDPALVEFKNCTGSNQIRVACPTSRTDKHPEKEIIWDWRASTPQELHLNGFTGGHLSLHDTRALKSSAAAFTEIAEGCAEVVKEAAEAFLCTGGDAWRALAQQRLTNLTVTLSEAKSIAGYENLSPLAAWRSLRSSAASAR